VNSAALIPFPAKPTLRSGSFALDPATSVVVSDDLRVQAELLRDQIRPAIGFGLPIRSSSTGSRIALALDPSLASLGAEGYRLTVDTEEVAIRAPKAAGILHGSQTLRQLLPPEIFRRAPVVGASWTIPAVEIEDRPRFGWRGSHLDVARHFMPKEFVLKHIDLLALHKFNVFHWHLTDDQGWRIDIQKYPKLTAVGAHAGFYAQDDVREVVRYAADRGITVLPEIEMPGHATAAIAAYPELGNTGKPIEVRTKWGISEHVLGVTDNVLRFFENVLEEVLDLFPSEFIHVGGDECPRTEWRQTPAAQERMKKEGLKNEDELQSWFIRHFDSWLAKRGRRLVGWDEILEGGLAPGATVMSWRGEHGGIVAAKAGHDVVMAPEKPTYLDHLQSELPTEPAGHGGHNSLEHVYAYEPVPKEFSVEEAKHVLGAQGQLWTEYMPDPKHVEYMAWPRLAALAEVLWSPPETRDLASFRSRLKTHFERLAILDVNYRGRFHG
jgi:hexosaminidase